MKDDEKGKAELIAELDQMRRRIAALEASQKQRQWTEEALRAERDYSSRIIDRSPAIICGIAPDGRTTFINPAGESITGYKAEEIVRQNWWRTFYPGDEYRQVEQLFRDFSEGDVRDYEMVLTAKDGSKRTISWNSINRYDESGALVEIIGFGNDVTEQKRAEEAVLKEERLLRRMLDVYDRERQLLAYEIHDGLAQQMAGAMLSLQAFVQLRRNDDREAQKSLDRAVQSLADSIAEARRLISGLRPPILDESGVVAAIDCLVRGWPQDEGPRIEFTHHVQFDRLAPPLENTIFRIVQESLTNACHHSKSPKVQVELLQHGDHIRVRVEDWGVGFDPAAVAPNRFGLQGIRERARLLGGEAVIDTAPGQGTRVTVELPLLDKPSPQATDARP